MIVEKGQYGNVSNPADPSPIWERDAFVFSLTAIIVASSIVIGLVVLPDHMVVDDEVGDDPFMRYREQ